LCFGVDYPGAAATFDRFEAALEIIELHGTGYQVKHTQYLLASFRGAVAGRDRMNDRTRLVAYRQGIGEPRYLYPLTFWTRYRAEVLKSNAQRLNGRVRFAGLREGKQAAHKLLALRFKQCAELFAVCRPLAAPHVMARQESAALVALWLVFGQLASHSLNP
jgi:hypothetical protein